MRGAERNDARETKVVVTLFVFSVALTHGNLLLSCHQSTICCDGPEAVAPLRSVSFFISHPISLAHLIELGLLKCR
jgi:hypothetical protein